jgi:hypothetical protein
MNGQENDKLVKFCQNLMVAEILVSFKKKNIEATPVLE